MLSSMPPSNQIQDLVQVKSLRDPEGFWDHHAKQLHWHKPYSTVLQRQQRKLLDNSEYLHWSWFPDGEISTTYNCVDRHVKKGNGDNLALIWDSPVTKAKERYTYSQLLEEVQALAGVLREQGVGKGDVVLIYMPMIPAAAFAMLAIARLGAIHAVVFGGFAANSLAQRIEASKPKIIMTASCAVEGTKGPLSYKPFVEDAVKISTFKPRLTIIWQRDIQKWHPVEEAMGQRSWQQLLASARDRGVRADAVPVKSTDGLYILYTSGTTGTPKGVLREAGGHAVGLNLSIKYLFDVTGPGDVIFTASDIGWVVGHSYIVYAPLLAGATTVLFEGKPIGAPDAGVFWRIVEEYKVSTLFTAPTALRAIRREDPESIFFREVGQRGGLRQLKAIFLAGERSEPVIIKVFQQLLNQYGASDPRVIDHWWSSESGSPISGVALRPSIGLNHSSQTRPSVSEIKHGSAGKPMPGFDVRIVDDQGQEVKQGEMGNIVLAIPLAPSAFTTLFNDEARFFQGYLKRFDGKWIDTGDAGFIDQDGYISVLSRTDDIINVAAHRLSTGAIEQAILSHEGVAEACVVGIPDPLKGQLPFAFTIPSGISGSTSLPTESLEQIFREINQRVRSQVGNIASLGGIIHAKGIIPKTRSGKTLRRVLRDLLENGSQRDYAKEVNFPATIEDVGVIEVAREKIQEYFEKDRASCAITKAKL